MKNKKILVLGSTGLLGCTLVPILERHGYEVLKQSRSSVATVVCNPLSFFELKHVILNRKPDAIVNLIAATSVDKCEIDTAYAYTGNVAPVANLAAVIQALKIDIPIIHISTDHLYDGPGHKIERDISLVNQYALSKYAAEGAILVVGGTVLRTNFFGKSHAFGRLSLTDWFYNLLLSQKEARVFNNVLINALHLTTLCEYIVRVIEHPVSGVFNLGCIDGYSKADLAYSLAKNLSLNAKYLTPGVYAPENGAARRPIDMRMDVSKFSSVYGCVLPDFESQLKICIGEYL